MTWHVKHTVKWLQEAQKAPSSHERLQCLRAALRHVLAAIKAEEASQ